MTQEKSRGGGYVAVSAQQHAVCDSTAGFMPVSDFSRPAYGQHAGGRFLTHSGLNVNTAVHTASHTSLAGSSLMSPAFSVSRVHSAGTVISSSPRSSQVPGHGGMDTRTSMNPLSSSNMSSPQRGGPETPGGTPASVTPQKHGIAGLYGKQHNSGSQASSSPRSMMSSTAKYDVGSTSGLSAEGHAGSISMARAAQPGNTTSNQHATRTKNLSKRTSPTLPVK